MLSALKNERVIASQIYPSPALPKDISHAFIANLQGALFASKLVSYAQGFAMMRAAAKVLFFTNHFSVSFRNITGTYIMGQSP